MSDSKWRKLIEAVAHRHAEISTIEVKFIDVDEPKLLRFPPSLVAPHAYMDTIEFGPVELRSIEWIDILGDIRAALNGIGCFPLEQLEGRTRVLGYVV